MADPTNLERRSTDASGRGRALFWTDRAEKEVATGRRPWAGLPTDRDNLSGTSCAAGEASEKVTDDRCRTAGIAPSRSSCAAGEASEIAMVEGVATDRAWVVSGGVARVDE